MTAEWKVVDQKFLDSLSRSSRNRYTQEESALVKALIEGQIIAVENEKPKKFQTLYRIAKRYNKKMNLRSGMNGDTPTIVFWWEPETEGAV